MRIILPILVLIVISISFIVWVLGFFSEDYSKPWFKGTESHLVCRRPYSKTSDCTRLFVSSDGEVITGIKFASGKYLDSYDAECYQADSYYNFDQVCQVWDQDGNSWDIIPAGGNVE